MLPETRAPGRAGGYQGPASSEAAVLGVDGTRLGWVGALLRGTAVRWLLLPDAAGVLSVDAAAVGIDIPIGLPERGPRSCDLAARHRLGPRASTLFITPPRAAVFAADYRSGCAIARELTGAAFSKQLWGIVPKIRDVDAVLRPIDQDRVVEVHPETSFGALAGAPLDRKRSARGVGQRLLALRRELDVDAALAAVPDGPALDDALDALVAAWSARRWLRGEAEVLGGSGMVGGSGVVGSEERDGRGLRMAIVC